MRPMRGQRWRSSFLLKSNETNERTKMKKSFLLKVQWEDKDDEVPFYSSPSMRPCRRGRPSGEGASLPRPGSWPGLAWDREVAAVGASLPDGWTVIWISLADFFCQYYDWSIPSRGNRTSFHKETSSSRPKTAAKQKTTSINKTPSEWSKYLLVVLT